MSAIFLRARGTTRGVAFVLFICIAFFIYWHTYLAIQSSQVTPELSGDPPDLPCQNLQGADETLVILRTGSTELDDRFSIHLSTSLRCFPQYLIFSDLEEWYHGEHILDALSSVSDDIKAKHDDFDIYRRIQRHGRSKLKPSELSGSPEAFERMSGNSQNPGWKLDKWKFMPMINRTMHEYPDMKWYVFIEADTFLLWSMLLQYLSLLDHTQPHYIGAGTCLGEHLFAHGGSGFVVSQPAMRLATQYYSTHKAEVEALTDQEWAGDYVLGRSFNAAGVPSTDAWPHFQGDYPGLVAYAGPDGRYPPAAALREWCMPTISYHHMSSDMVKDLWDFEQRWIGARENHSNVLTHGDVFKEHVMPQMMEGKAEWDNLSDEDEGEVSDMDACRAKCEAQLTCKQYSFVRKTKQCKTRVDPRLGKQSNGTESGWLKDRVLDFARNMPACGQEGWQVGSATRQTRCI
ncbi:hypothetical protein Q7P37_008794 [Cladosporium fusiforme]